MEEGKQMPSKAKRLLAIINYFRTFPFKKKKFKH